ncbi:trimeric LpxA-like protein [Diplogelasinospora grovesii]|uniref:Trimeric LpxA-like protein n=1 Tax=Diplogelasinospora grovesii TaxID=303347 RepID=A0AAN6MZ98_9PEZI|nr:trimeric LpxA-like protein [Diplogelasinospora grovesii]
MDSSDGESMESLLHAAAAATAGTAGIAFPAGNDDFRAARNRCAQACRRFNNTPEDAAPELRSSRWLDIVRPARERTEDAVNGTVVTHDMTFRNPALTAQTPFVKPPFYVDYGLRLRVAGSTFINRGCMIMDTPVADVVIGDHCNVGPNCCIVSVSHALQPDERCSKRDSIGKSVRVGDHVWIGANVTILGGITIGDGAVIGAGSVITKSIPPLSMALGVPARVVQSLADLGPPEVFGSVQTLTEAMAHGRRLEQREKLELVRLSHSLRRQNSHSSVSSSSHASHAESQPYQRHSHQHPQQQQPQLEHHHQQQQQQSQHRQQPRPETPPQRQPRQPPGNTAKLSRSDILAIVSVTAVTFTLLTSLFFAGALAGAKRFAIILEPADRNWSVT